MSDDTPAPSPYTNDRPDPASEPKSTVADVSGAVKSVAHVVMRSRPEESPECLSTS